jgi:hypothetical protein
MLPIGTCFSAFQVKAVAGLEPGKSAELSGHRLEGKSPTHRRETQLASRLLTRGTATPLAA